VAVGHRDVGRLRQRNPQVLGLTTGHLAVQLAEAEQRSPRALLSHLGGLALREQARPAHPALATRDLERDDDPVAHAQVADLGANLLHDPHRLVAQDVADTHERTESLVQVQV